MGRNSAYNNTTNSQSIMLIRLDGFFGSISENCQKFFVEIYL